MASKWQACGRSEPERAGAAAMSSPLPGGERSRANGSGPKWPARWQAPRAG